MGHELLSDLSRESRSRKAHDLSPAGYLGAREPHAQLRQQQRLEWSDHQLPPRCVHPRQAANSVNFLLLASIERPACSPQMHGNAGGVVWLHWLTPGGNQPPGLPRGGAGAPGPSVVWRDDRAAANPLAQTEPRGRRPGEISTLFCGFCWEKRRHPKLVAVHQDQSTRPACSGATIASSPLADGWKHAIVLVPITNSWSGRDMSTQMVTDLSSHRTIDL